MLDLNQIISDSSKKGLITVKAINNGIMQCETLSSKKVWFMPVTTFVQRVNDKSVEVVDATTFKFVSKTAEELFKG